MSFIDDLRRSTEFGVEETWRYDIDAGEFSPLSSQALTEVADGSFRAVVHLCVMSQSILHESQLGVLNDLLADREAR